MVETKAGSGAMTDSERIKRLEDIVLALIGALIRKDSDQNGNWGYPPFVKEMCDLGFELYPTDDLSTLLRVAQMTRAA